MRRTVLFLAAALAVAAQSRKAFEYFHLGKADAPHGQPASGFLLAGGGRTPDDAYRWFVRKAGAGEVVTLRASGGEALNQAFLDAGATSASTLLFHDGSAATDPF